MEHDSPKLLFRQACEYLSSSILVRPGIVKILERVAAARERAREETPMLLARSRHASVRSLERYARPGPEAVVRHVAAADPAARRRRP